MAAALAPLPASRPGQAVQQPLAMAPSTAGAGPSAVQPLAIAAPSSKPASAAGLASGGLSPISEVASVEVGHTAFALCVCSAAFVVKTVPLLAAPQEEAPAPQSDGPLKSSSAASVRPAKHVSPASWPRVIRQLNPCHPPAGHFVARPAGHLITTPRCLLISRAPTMLSRALRAAPCACF